MDKADKGRLMIKIGVFFRYQLTRVVPDKIQRAVKWLCVFFMFQVQHSRSIILLYVSFLHIIIILFHMISYTVHHR